MADNVARWLDFKLRAASRNAKLSVREAQRLLQRGKRALSTDITSNVQAAIATVQEATRSGDAASVMRANDRLTRLVNENLQTFRKPAWRESVESIGMAVLVALLLRSFVLEAFKIPSGSMIPTLAIGDQIFVNKYIYGLRIPFTSIRLVDFAAPKRGEVIVFVCPVEPHEDYIKRIVGLPGDEVAVRSGVIYINGEPIKHEPLGKTSHWDRDSSGDHWRSFNAMAFRETLGEHTYTVLQDADISRSAPDFGPTVVPAGSLLMMGDNRDHSYDSRSWGPAPVQNILGRSMFVWWSWGQDGADVSRIGTWID